MWRKRAKRERDGLSLQPAVTQRVDDPTTKPPPGAEMLGRERDLDGHKSSFGDEEVETDAHKKDSFSTGDVHAGNVVVVAEYS